MACELDIKTLIAQNVKNLFVLRGTGVVDGGTYDADPELVSLLDDIASETGTELYEIFDSGRKIKVSIAVPDATLRSYGKTARPSWKTPYEREQAIFDIDHGAVAENIQKLYEKRFKEFERLLQDVLLAAQAKVSQLRRSGMVDDELANFSRVVAELQENPDLKQRALAVARFVAEAASVMQESVKNLPAIQSALDSTTGKEHEDVLEIAFLTVSNLMEHVGFYESALRDMRQAVSATIDSPLKKLVEQASADLVRIKDFYSTLAKEVSLDSLHSTVSDKYEKAKVEHQKEIKRLEDQFLKATSNKERQRLRNKIDRMRSDFENLAPSNSVLEAHLIGDAVDSSLLHKFVLSGMDNSDVFVQGFTKLLKDRMQQATMAFKTKSSKFLATFQGLIDNGFDPTKIEENLKELHEDVQVFRYDEENDEIVEEKVKFFKDDISHKWRTEYSSYRAKVAKLTAAIRRERLSDDHTELLKLENELSKLSLEFSKWKRDNLEGEFNEEYQAIQSLLDTSFEFDGRTVTARELRDRHFSVITDIQNRIDLFQGGVPSDEDLLAIQSEREAYEMMRSPAGKVEGTEQWRLMELLNEFHNRMADATQAWVITPEALRKFERDKARINRQLREGTITQEDADRWMTANVTINFDPRYWTARKTLVGKLGAIANQMKELTGDSSRVELEEFYRTLEELNRKYRDHNGIIDGTALKEDERTLTKLVDTQIETLKSEGRKAFGGYLGAWFDSEWASYQSDIDRHIGYIHEIKKMDPTLSAPLSRANMAVIKGELERLRKEQSALPREALKRKGLDQAAMDTFMDLFKSYETTLKELGALTDSFYSSYYYDEYSKQRKIFLSSFDAASVDRKLLTATVRGKKYALAPDGYYRPVLPNGNFSKEEPFTFSEIKDELFDDEFKDSAWYVDNHYETTVWDREAKSFTTKMAPIYSWRVTGPANKNFIQEEAPNQSWKKRKVKDSYRNPDGGLDIAGQPKPKAAVWRDMETEALRAAKPDLWKFRDTMIAEYLDAQTYYDQKDRMGMRVPTVRKDLNLTSIGEGKLSKNVLEDLKRDWTLNDQDLEQGYTMSDEMGFEKRVVPIMLRGKMDADVVSNNILKTVGKYVGQAEVYKARRELSRTAKAIENTLEHESHTPASRRINRIAARLGFKRHLKAKGENQRLDTVRSLTRMIVYGESVSHDTDAGKQWYKVVSNLLGIKAMSIFAGTWLSQGVNWVGGTIQQVIKASVSSGEAKFGFSDLVWAGKTYLQNSDQFVKDIGRVSNRSFWTQFAELFDANELELIDAFGNQLDRTGLVKNARIDIFMGVKTIVEHELFMTTLMAFSRNYLVNSDKGKIPLKDAFEMRGGSIALKSGVELSQKEMMDIKGYMNALLKDINGNYNKLDKTLVETYWFGKSLLFMRKWIITQSMHRWGGKKFSIEQDRIIEGYYVTTAKFLANGFKTRDMNALKALIWTDENADPSLTSIEKDAIKRTKTEFGLMVALTLILQYVLGYDDEDEDRFKKLQKAPTGVPAATYILAKSISEQSIFLPVVNAREYQVLKNNLLSNLFPFADQAIDIVRKDFDFQNIVDPDDPFLVRQKSKGPFHEKGDIKLFTDLSKIIGFNAAKRSSIEALRTFEKNLNR
jgi:hypothetical protein